MKNLTKIIIIGAFSSFLLTGCGDSSSKSSTTTRNTLEDCYNQTYNTGIIGNEHCPYQGEYDPNYGYQGYAISYSARVGIYVDFGWDYNDLCPQGQAPVLSNGDFSYCMPVNQDHVQTDFINYAASNSGECAGKQWNTAATGCLPDFSFSNY